MEAQEIKNNTMKKYKIELTEKYDGDPLVTRGIDMSVNEAKELLEKEEEQIIDAYNHGCIDTLNDEMKQGKQYYNETYKQ